MSIAARNAILAGGAALPYDAEVEYLESTGTQWIDTGVVLNGALDIDITYLVTAFTANNNIAFYGCKGLGVGFFSGVASPPGQGDTKYYYYINNVDEEIAADVFLFALGTKYRDRTDGTTYHHGAASTTVTAQVAMSQSMPLFARRNDSGVIERIGTMRFYEAKIYSGGVLVRDFIPVRFTNENGVTEGAMYDRVSGTLFRNAGTGAFVIGPDK